MKWLILEENTTSCSAAGLSVYKYSQRYFRVREENYTTVTVDTGKKRG